MIRHEQYKIGETPVYYCQAETLEEAGKFEPGQHFYWEYNGVKYDQAGLMRLIIQWSKDGKFTPQTMITANNVKSIYKQMIEGQKKAMLGALDKMKSHMVNMGAPTNEIDRTIDQIGNLGFPSIDGVFRPTVEEMAALAGGKAALDAILSAREQMELAGILSNGNG